MKKLIAVFLSIIMVAGLVCVGAFAIEDNDGPKAVKNAAEFASMSPTGNYYLDADIAIDVSYPGVFSGTFDGKGHTITVTVPVFTGVSAAVSNLTIVGAVNDTTDDLGALARTANGGTYKNITNKATVTSTTAAKKLVGGLIGYLSSDEKITFTDCSNEGDVTGYVNGGIVGKSSAPADYINCRNTANITGGDATGGLIGWGVETFNVKNCINGSFGKTYTVSAESDSAAGIMGYVSGSNTGVFENCVNYANASDTESPAAGIVGRAGGKSSIECINCVNYGEINSTAAKYAAGGILGESGGSAYFTNCRNFGKITDTGYRAAGIAGYIDLMGKFTGCYNEGEIHGLKMAGGITANVGCSDVEAGSYVFEYCANEGKITADNSTAGGICAYVYGKAANAPEFYYCYNTGDVSGGEETGSMIGYYNGTANLKMEYCYNTGKITGTGSVDSTALYYCNYGTATVAENIKGVYYLSGCAKYERFDAKAYVPMSENLTAEAVANGKLMNDLNTAAGKQVYMQEAGTAHPVLFVQVKWVVGDKTLTGYYNMGETPSFAGTVSRAADAQYTYTFTDWDKEIKAVTGNTVYTANFNKTLNKYTIKWVVEGTETADTVEYGKMPAFNGTPAKTGDKQYTYTFAGWDKAITAVTGDAVYTAKFDAAVNKYTIKWVVDGKETSEKVEYGKTPAFNGSTDKAEDAQYTYAFDGWDKEIVAVNGDATYTAKFTKTEKATETDAPKPSETDTPKPSETDAPKPSETDAPKPSETDAPKPSETDAPKPSETDAPKPSETDTPKSGKSCGGVTAAVQAIALVIGGLGVAVIVKRKH